MRQAARIYYVYVAFQALAYALAATLQLVYQVQVVDLTPFQLVLVGTVLEFTVFAFEIPTGVVADRFSRKLSILIGCVLSAVGFLFQGLIPTFWAAVACSLIWGIGYTFISGAGQAWLVDEVGADNAQPAFTRARQIGLAVTVVGIVLACLLGLHGLGLPLAAAGITFLGLAVFLFFFMPEAGFRPTRKEERETFASMRQVVAGGLRAIRTNQVVLTMVLVSLFVGLASEAVDRLWVDRLLKAFTLSPVGGLDGPTVWFTVFALVGNVLSLGVSLTVNKVMPRTFNGHHPNVLLASLMLVQVVGIAMLAVGPVIGLALAGVWLRRMARDLEYPVQSAWMNRNLESESRATVMSMSSQVDSFGQVVGGPSIGALGSRLGVAAALITSAIVLSPAVGLFWLLKPAGPRTEEEPASTSGASAYSEG